ncbi:MAG: ArnT family glycosyltransferase [Methylophilaceae bacterium]
MANRLQSIKQNLPALNFKILSLGLLTLIAIFIAFTFDQHGISNDEEVQHVYGRLLLQFYKSGFVDQDAFHYRNLYLYGGFFDLIAATFEHILPIWVWDMRHLLSALFGLAGIVASYKIARILGGERAGFITVVLLAITGAWSGAMFTHTKDIPFGTCMVWALYYTILIAQQLPKPKLGISIKLGIAIGCALGLRIGGVFAVFYLLLMIALAGWVSADSMRERFYFWLNSIKPLIPAAVVAFILMAIFWPWGVMAPDHPLEAAKAFSHFAFNMLTVMDGEVMNIGQVPREYLPEYLFVRLPEIFLLGLVSAIVIFILRFSLVKTNRFDDKHPLFIGFISVFTAAAFPLAFILLDKPALYNGVRHFTFILPPLAIIAALGIHFAISALNSFPKLRLGFIAVCWVLVINTSCVLVQLHPYEYIYYNYFAGDLSDAEKEWEGDYWSSSLREASDMLEDKVTEMAKTDPSIDAHIKQKPYTVAVCAEALQGSAYLDHRFVVTSDWVKADFFISSTNMNCDKVLKGKIIGEVERMDAVLAVVKDRRDLPANLRQPRPAPK